MKNKLKLNILLFFTLLTLSLSSLTGCYYLFWGLHPEDEYEQIELTLISEPEMSYIYNEETEAYDIRIEGVCENSSDKDLDGGYVAVTVYDADGNIIATSEEYVSYVKAGERWRFCAVGASRYVPDRFNITELYGW